MLDSETAERRAQMFGELERERDKLNAEVENLRAFEREYRSRLKSYFTQQLESLAGPGESPAAGDEQAAGAQAAALDPRRRGGLSVHPSGWFFRRRVGVENTEIGCSCRLGAANSACLDGRTLPGEPV